MKSKNNEKKENMLFQYIEINMSKEKLQDNLTELLKIKKTFEPSIEDCRVIIARLHSGILISEEHIDKIKEKRKKLKNRMLERQDMILELNKQRIETEETIDYLKETENSVNTLIDEVMSTQKAVEKYGIK